MRTSDNVSRGQYASRCLMIIVSMVVGLASCKSPAIQQDEIFYEEDLNRWREGRVEALERPDGWLSLVGLYWLQEGSNTIGSESANQHVFPSNAPPRIGTMSLEEGQVIFSVHPGVEVFHDGEAVASVKMTSDVAGNPTVLSHASFSWHVIDRDGRLGIRLKDSNSIGLRAFESLEYFLFDPSWRIEANFESYNPPKTIPVPTVLGTVTPQPSAGAIVFNRDGATHRLDVIGESGADSYFVIFGDLTNGEETYGAGRFLDVEGEDENGNVVIDFNKAYNPPCVFTSYATCPYPPSQNRLSIRVEAGELMYAHHPE